MAVSEESVQAKREQLEKLRAEAQQEVFKRQANEVKADLILADAQLDAQIKEAEANLAREKRLSSLSVVKESVEPIVEAAKDEAKVAAQVVKAEEKEGK